MNLNNITNSIKFGADKSVILKYRTTNKNIHLCGNNTDIKINIPINIEFLRVIIYRQNVSTVLYKCKNYL